MADEGITRSLGRTARQFRERGGVTMLDIASTSGLSESTVSRFECGGGRQPLATADRLVAAYATELGIDPRDIWRAAIGAWD